MCLEAKGLKLKILSISRPVALGYSGPSSAFVIPHIFMKATKIHKELMKTKLVRKFPTSCFDGARAYNDRRLEIIPLYDIVYILMIIGRVSSENSSANGSF